MATILIVDDSSSQRLALSQLVERLGHTPMLAANGAQGVKLAIAHTPDLILMDVVMPEMNGYQATRTLTQGAETGHIPIVLVTSKDQETDELWGRRQGAKAYITKPVDEASLVRVIQEHVNDVATLRQQFEAQRRSSDAPSDKSPA